MEPGPELLTVEEMGRADALAIEAGTPGLELMERAGAGIVRAIRRRFPRGPVLVLAGPGNNGGDGFVAARRLRDAGWPVTVSLLGSPDALKGDARSAAERFGGPVGPLATGALDGRPLVLDALFGAGLARPVDGAPAEILDAVARRGLTSVAVDVPSGVHGDSGAVLGTAAPAALTVTFFRLKPGHLLMPGRLLCGAIELVDIGIRDAVLPAIRPSAAVNEPALWADRFPWPAVTGHKYRRGHALVVGGASMTGAGRLAAAAARRVGAGLVTVVAPAAAHGVYAADAPGTIVADAGGWGDLLADPRRNAVLVGPGAGVGAATRAAVHDALEAGKALVLDADAISSFAEQREELYRAASAATVLTPHEAEFGRVFDAAGDKLSRARRAAARCGAVMLLKGPDTVVAAPDGRAVINRNAPPTLATAGSGDVLAGLVLGLLAQGVDGFRAACMAVWLQGRAAAGRGPGLIAEDLIEAMPEALTALAATAGGRGHGRKITEN